MTTLEHLHLAEACAAGGDQPGALRHLAAAEQVLEPSTARLSQAELEAQEAAGWPEETAIADWIARAREALRRQARGEPVTCLPGTAIRAAARLEANRHQLDADAGEAPE